MNNTIFEVYVSCMTFNHARFIKDTLDGFCMQQTSFPYVCGIIDDASTDGESKLIKDYLKSYFEFDDESMCTKEETDDYIRIFTRHKTNKNCYFVVVFLKYNHYQIKKSKWQYVAKWREYAKYYAPCEGDDYWIDTMKLQKQFDLMERHVEYAMCFHANEDVFSDGRKIIHKPKEIKETYTPEDAILGGGAFMATNSMFYRYDYLKKEGYPIFWKNSPIGDMPCMLYFASKGPIGYIDDVMSVYRIQTIGSWTSQQNTLKVRTAHNRAILKMLDEFDNYTGFNYHDAIQKKKRINRKILRNDIITTILSRIKRVLFFEVK